MSFDRLKNLFSRTFESKDEDSLLSQATNFITSARRTTTDNPTAEFQSYLAALPQQELKQLRGQKRSTRTASLKPQLVKRCYQSVPQLYFQPDYEIKGEMFVRNRRETAQQTGKMHEQLDEVELCLFNQISSRFDEILSVLRTVESLECIVVFNAQRLRQVREGNMRLAKRASERHLRIVTLLRRQERINKTLAKLSELKEYQRFLAMGDEGPRLQRTNSEQHQAINDLRNRRDQLMQLKAARAFEQRVEEFQATLKKSYSDSVNDALFRYAAEVMPYQSTFWEKKFAGRQIFQQEKDAEGTVILDESVLAEEEGGVRIRMKAEVQTAVAEQLLGGWREGEYTVGSLKAAMEKLLREQHHRFLSDLRNFAFQSHIRFQRKKVENPSLANLLREMSVPFCAKAFSYYADCLRSLVARTFSTAHCALRTLLQQDTKALNLEERERLGAVIDGLFNLMAFLFKMVYERLVEVVELKEAHEAMDLADFRQLVAVYEAEEDFIDKYLRPCLAPKCSQESGLSSLVAGLAARVDLSLLLRAKKQKVAGFLDRTHRFVLQSELRQSFENEGWLATDIPTFYYDSLHYLITGESLNLRRNRSHLRPNASVNFESSVFVDRLAPDTLLEQQGGKMGNFRIIRSQIIIEGRTYKVTQTLLLLLEMLEDYLQLAQLYPFAEVGARVAELMRTYNTSSHQLIILGGAVKLGRIKTKNIAAKHLALDSLCLSFLLFIIDCISKRISIPDQQKLRRQLQTHQETAIRKLGSILAGKITQALPEVNLNATPSKGTEAIVNNTKVLHDILADFYSKETLAKIFTKQNVQNYLNKLKGMDIRTKLQAEALKDDLNFYFHELKFLERIVADFRALRLEGEELIRTRFEDL